MMTVEHKRISNYKAWLPMHLRKDRFGLSMPPRKPDLRLPLYWLASKGAEVYFVNNTDETLNSVSTSTNGFVTCDDEVAPVSSEGYEYQNILPKEAIKIEEFDEVLDSDFSFQLSLKINSPRHGLIHLLSPLDMKNSLDVVLLWNTAEAGKHVSITSGALQVASKLS